MTALFESFSLTIILDVFSLSIPTLLHFSRVGKPVLDRRLPWPTPSPWLRAMVNPKSWHLMGHRHHHSRWCPRYSCWMRSSTPLTRVLGRQCLPCVVGGRYLSQ